MPTDPVRPKVIELQAQNGRFELVLDNPHAKRLTMFQLGDRKMGFMPPPKMTKDFRALLEQAMASEHLSVVMTVSHPFVSVLQVDLPEGPVVVTSPAPTILTREGYTPVNLADGGAYRATEDDHCFVVATEARPDQPVWLSRQMIEWLHANLGSLT
jgi:hypothetical protein